MTNYVVIQANRRDFVVQVHREASASEFFYTETSAGDPILWDDGTDILWDDTTQILWSFASNVNPRILNANRRDFTVIAPKRKKE